MAVVEEQRLNSAVLHCCGPMPPDDDEVQLRDVFSLCPPPQYKPALDIICSREVDLQCFRGLPGNTCYAPEREREWETELGRNCRESRLRSQSLTERISTVSSVD